MKSKPLPKLLPRAVPVSKELARRRNHRTGLEGVVILHRPTGDIFTCRGSTWDIDARLQLYRDDGLVYSDDCMLISEWPLSNAARLVLREKKQQNRSS